MADVRREKELAERRKNEPQLDQNQDHLVRKIFSKFRRDRTPASSSTAPAPPDVERGGTSDTDSESHPHLLSAVPLNAGTKSVVRVLSTTKLACVTEDGAASSSSGTLAIATTTASLSRGANGTTSGLGHRPGLRGASKWGRLLGSSSLDSGAESATATTTASGTGVARSFSARDHKVSRRLDN